MNYFESPDEINRLELGLQILARIEAEKNQQPAWTNAETFDLNSAAVQTPTLNEMLQEVGPLPEHSLLMGLCEDGLPILLDLASPNPGSILLIADPGAGKSQALYTFATSGARTNSNRAFRYACLTPYPGEFSDLKSDRHCYKVASTSSRQAADLIKEMAEIAEQRRYGRQQGPALLLLVDNLIEAGARLDQETYFTLDWLIQAGPASNVYVIATLDARQLKSVDPALLDRFGAWLVGKIDPTRVGTRLSRIPLDVASRLIAGQQFSVYFQDEWIPFWIPSETSPSTHHPSDF